MTRVGIVGAGAAGLATARRLLESGVDVVIFEAGSYVGGLWVYENDNGFSLAYRSLHINSESAITAFAGFPFPAGTPLYPSHEDMAAYFADFAEHFGLLDRIRFSTLVEAARPQPGGGWELTLRGNTDGLSGSSTETVDAVVVACGHQNGPRHADFVTDFAGEYLHSHGYRRPEPYADKDVLVIGAGNSALDIAADVCTLTRSTTLAVRSPVQILPRMLLGAPTARLLGRTEQPWVPWAVSRRLRNLICRIAHGPMEQWGFTTPSTRTHPTSHPTLIHHMAWQWVIGKPGVESVRDWTVRFADGSEQKFDVIIGATGYEIELPMLSAELNPLNGHDLELYRRIVHPDVPGLYFAGFFNVSGGANISMMDHQASWIARVVAGDIRLPAAPAMRRSIAADKRYIRSRYPSSARYGLELEPRRYLRQLAADRKAAAVKAGPR